MTFPDAANGDSNDTISPASGGTFLITGDANANFCVQNLSDNNLSLSGQSIPIQSLTAEHKGASITIGGSKCCSFDGSGNATVNVGGVRSTIGNGDPVGNWTGAITATVRYYESSKCQAGSATSGTTNMAMRRITSLTITKVSDLKFGKVAAGDPATVVSAAPTGYTNVSPATFTLAGEPSYAFNVTLSTTSLTMSNGTCTLPTVCTIAVTSLNASTTSSTLNASGSYTLYVGGTRAAITANHKAGNYTSGNVLVTVAYP